MKRRSADGRGSIAGQPCVGASVPLLTATMSSSIAAALSDVGLPDADGREVRLGSLWQSGPAVLVFLRHYG